MKTKILMAIVVSLLVISVVSVGLVGAKPDNPGKGRKPDKQRPVPATDVELVKKVSIGRPGPPIIPPGQTKPRKGKKRGAATGILGDTVSGSRYAVVVGISDYPGEENDLEYCDDDAIEMADALYLYYFTNVALLTNLEATRAAILTAIEDIAYIAGSDDEVVFFFSGHGVKGLAQDWDKERVDEGIVVHDGTNITYIWDGELQAAFSGFDTSRIIFIFDTCLAGGMKRDLEADGRVIAMATTENGTAIERSDLENGEFTYYFVDEGMLQGKANVHDYDEDEVLEEPEQVTVEEAFDYAKANCAYDKPTIGDEFENDLLP
ncbi:hypothetical protein ES703_72974 [subsurface metagenome]